MSLGKSISHGNGLKPTSFLKSEDQLIFNQLIKLIDEKDYKSLYNTLLYQVVSTIINSVSPEKMIGLLHHAALVNDEIAFDILLNFGAKIDNEWLQLFVEKLNTAAKPTTDGIHDRILGLLSDEYSAPSKEEILDKVKRLPPKEAPSIIQHLNLVIDLSPVQSKDKYLGSAYQVLFKDPRFTRLVIDATKHHPINVKFLRGTSLYSYAECDYAVNEVHISEDVDLDHKFVALIVELSNAANEQLRRVYFAGFTHHKSANDFALAMESSEYLSTAPVVEVISSICENQALREQLQKCGISLDFIIQFAQSYDFKFDGYWEANNQKMSDKDYPNKGHSHADYYRRAFTQWKTLQTKLTDKNQDKKAITESPAPLPLTVPRKLVARIKDYLKGNRFNKSLLYSCIAAVAAGIFSLGILYATGSLTLLSSGMSAVSVLFFGTAFIFANNYYNRPSSSKKKDDLVIAEPKEPEIGRPSYSATYTPSHSSMLNSELTTTVRSLQPQGAKTTPSQQYMKR
ncbi:MAG: hypothetical protein ACHQJ6_03910 [Candidatus Berkiellales bacterium]